MGPSVVASKVYYFFDYALKRALAIAGGVVAMPKMALMGMAWQGYFLDTEHNVFGLHQVDKNAK